MPSYEKQEFTGNLSKVNILHAINNGTALIHGKQIAPLFGCDVYKFNVEGTDMLMPLSVFDRRTNSSHYAL
jgi:hypothetical protein